MRCARLGRASGWWRTGWSVPETGDGVDLLRASVSAGPSSTLVRLAGEGDVTVCDQLRGMLTAQVLAGARNLVVDLSGVGFLDSSCLHVLLAACRMAEQADGSLKLVSPQPMVARMMALWGADRLIAVHASVAEAAG